MIAEVAVRARALEILREGKEISPGVYHGVDQEELDDIVTAGATEAVRVLRPLERRPTVIVYRGVRLDPEGEVNLDRLGVYWTWDERFAESYWSTSKRIVIVRGRVERSGADWETSAALLALRGLDELELRLRPEIDVFVEAIDDRPIRCWGNTS